LIMRKLSGWVGAAALLFAGPAFAADLAVNAPVYKAPPLVPGVSWTGFYVGVNAGWVHSKDTLSTTATPTPDDALAYSSPGVTEGLAALTDSTASGSRNGFIGGGQVGYNWQFGSVVTGLEADIQGVSGLKNSGSAQTAAMVAYVPVTSLLTAAVDTKYLGTVRGRIGFLATPTLLVYGTGGLAYGGVSASASVAQAGINGFAGAGAGSFSDTRVGWAAGAGLEWLFAPKWSVKAEYLHYDLGTAKFTWSAAGTSASTFFANQVYQTNVSSARFDGDMVRAGVNYHF
jgi:outer membrane immunogenic protein